MKPGNWLAMIAAAWLPMVGCGGDEADIDDGDNEGDEGEDTVDNDYGEEEEMALISFCNPLAYNNEAAVMQVVIGDGDDALVLEASTGTCSNRLGDPCVEIDPGEDIHVTVVDENGAEHFETQINIEPDAVYVLKTNMDSESNIILDHGTLSENFSCKNVECNTRSVNDRTCAPDDPCDWAENQQCEDYCLDYVDEMFDDSVDCSK